MRSIETAYTFPLSSVKPLAGLTAYREHCLKVTCEALKGKTQRRSASPVGRMPLSVYGSIGDVEYGQCPETGSLFLLDLPEPHVWAKLLKDVAAFRNSPKAFHSSITGSRAENVYRPKLDWIENTLRIQGLSTPSLLEVSTPPSPFIDLVQQDPAFESVEHADEMALIHRASSGSNVDAAILLESVDRVDAPAALLAAVFKRLKPEGLLFLTSLVSSGFDFKTLGLKNHYLYPPDRTNCFSLDGLKKLVTQAGFKLIEVSTPGVLDVEIVLAHRKADSTLSLSNFERSVLDGEEETRIAFQSFLQQRGLSSFARIVARKGS